jgi:hypothetical protein
LMADLRRVRRTTRGRFTPHSSYVFFGAGRFVREV